MLILLNLLKWSLLLATQYFYSVTLLLLLQYIQYKSTYIYPRIKTKTILHCLSQPPTLQQSYSKTVVYLCKAECRRTDSMKKACKKKEANRSRWKQLRAICVFWKGNRIIPSLGVSEGEIYNFKGNKAFLTAAQDTLNSATEQELATVCRYVSLQRHMKLVVSHTSRTVFRLLWVEDSMLGWNRFNVFHLKEFRIGSCNALPLVKFI